MKLRISEPAREDLLEIWQHVAANNPEAAERLMRSFKKTFEKLIKFPGLGREREELAIGVRSSLPASTSSCIKRRTKF